MCIDQCTQPLSCPRVEGDGVQAFKVSSAAGRVTHVRDEGVVADLEGFISWDDASWREVGLGAGGDIADVSLSLLQCDCDMVLSSSCAAELDTR